MQTQRPAVPYWCRSATEVMADLDTRIQGLSSDEAAERLRRYGLNAIDGRIEFGSLALLLRQIKSPLVLILVFGAVVSLFLRDWIDAAIILVIVLGSTLLGFVQEYRASAAVVALRSRLALTSRVFRDGTVRTVPAREVVPGDIIRLAAGNLVPADGLVLDAKDFLVSEASLTGESFPVEKRPGVTAADAALPARTNSVFLGTSVRSGTATVLAVETGRRTTFGKVATRLGTREEETDFARGVRQFGYLLIRITLMLVVFVLTINQWLGRSIIESLLFAVALAVGLSPELLPAIISVTLSAGARAMARRGVIVRRLESIENLGSMDILCTDKTGTLTQGIITLTETVDPDGQFSSAVRKLAFLNAAFETGIENPLDAAIVTAGEQEGLRTDGYRKIDEIPYDFLRKRLTVVVTGQDQPEVYTMVVKGAVDNVLTVCTTFDRAGTEVVLSDLEIARFQEFCRQKGDDGFRVLAVATKRLASKERCDRDDECDLCLQGFLIFADPPKQAIETVIQNLAARGISIKIVSGDNRYVTGHLAKAVGLDPKAMLTGAEIADLRDEALWYRAERTDLFVEVDPQQKERIIHALQRTGHSVGYLGDGINDAPALHAADVGISVDQAVDVARESADIVLLEPDLEVLCKGVEDGRRTFANTLKYICITTSANFGNMISMALVTPFLPFLPLAAKQILLNNFLSDLPSVAISTDNVDADSLAHAQRWQIHDIQSFMIVFGIISSAFDVLTFAVLFLVFSANEATFQTAWFVVSLLTELAVVMVLRTQQPVLSSRPGRFLALATAVVALAALVLPFSGALAVTFNFVPLSWHLLVTLILIVIAYLVVTEIAKLRFFGALRRTHQQRRL